MEPYTRWERRKDVVMFFSSISKINIEEILQQKEIDPILKYLYSLDNDVYKQIILFI